MKTHARHLIGAVTLLALLVVALPKSLQGTNPGHQTSLNTAVDNNSAAQHDLAVQNMSAIPLAFTENKGQWNEQVLYRASSGRATMWFTREGIYYQFTRRVPKASETGVTGVGAPLAAPWAGQALPLRGGPPFMMGEARPDSVETLVLKASFVGANPSVEIVGEGLMEYKCNYFLGNDPAKWRTDVPNYSAFVLKEIYPGIDLRCSGVGNGKAWYEFVAEPGADLGQVRVEYEGVEELAVDESGRMVARTAWGEMTAVVASPVGGTRPDSPHLAPLAGSMPGFAVAGGEGSQQAAPFAITLDYSTFLGGSGDDHGYGIAVDGSGCAYVTGWTESSNFPTQNAYDASYNGNTDVFVTKLSSTGNALVYSTFLGGSSGDAGWGIAVDGSGCAYVTGWTYSSNFPTLNAYDASFNGAYDVFVTKLSTGGNTLAYSTFLGGSNYDFGWCIAIDSFECAYVSGATCSSNFPTKNAYDVSFNGGFDDVFVAKMSANGNSLVYSTYLGGLNTDDALDVAVDDSGCAYVTGMTLSADFPTLNAYDASFNGGSNYGDVFMTKLSSAGNALVYSTYVGGPNDDYAEDIAIDAFGCAYISGATGSSGFPTQNAYDASYNGSGDVFVTKFSAGGNTLVYSTFLGDWNQDRGFGIAVDGAGCAYVTGETHSSDFPAQNAFDASYNGSGDVFVTKLSAGGNALVYSTFLGGTGYEYGFGITVDESGCAYVTGETRSHDFPSQNAYDASYNGGYYDAFVTKLSQSGPVNEPPIALIDDIAPSPARQGESVTFTGHGEDADGTITAYNWRSDIDGLLSAQASFMSSSLSVGTHKIFFKVQDDDGAWSPEEEATQFVWSPGGLSAGIFPASIEAELCDTAIYNVWLLNQTSSRHLCTLTVSDLGTMDWFLDRDTLDLQPGEWGQSQLAVITPPTCTGDTGTVIFQVTAEAIGDPGIGASANASIHVASKPEISNLLPTGGLTLASNRAVFIWTTRTLSSSKVFYKKLGAASYAEATGPSDKYHVVEVTGLDFDTTYAWYAQSISACGTATSGTFTFHTGRGVTFDQSNYFFSIWRSYDQRRTIRVTNADVAAHEVLAEVINPYSDLIVGFTGNGSTDSIIQLPPGASASLNLAMHAQDALDTNYSIAFRLTSLEGDGSRIYDYAVGRIYVQWPDTNFVLQDLGLDVVTLVRSMRLLNMGDTVTDFNVAVENAVGIDYLVVPQIEHALLGPGEFINFALIPTFQDTVTLLKPLASCRATVVATGAGKEVRYQLSDCCDEGVFLVRKNQPVLFCSNFSVNERHCTNAPQISVNFAVPNIRSGTVVGAVLSVELAPVSDANDHTVSFYLNGHLVGRLANTVPSGVYEFVVDPSILFISTSSPSVNRLQLISSNFNRGHYVVAMNFSLCLCIEDYAELICAADENEALTTLNSRPYLHGRCGCDCSHQGDCNSDGVIGPVDVVYMVNYVLRLTGPPPLSDAACPAINRGDWDCNGQIDLPDVIKMVNYVYRYPAPGPCDPCQ